MRRMVTRAIVLVALAVFVYVAGFGATPTSHDDATAAPPLDVQSAAAAHAAAAPVQEMLQMHEVVRIVDGDTIVVREGTSDVKVRLIGLDTPETVDPRRQVQCFGKEASEEARRMLEGARVRLEGDPSQGEYDKYGRRLAYVFLQDGTFFNLHMIAEGFGHEYTYRTLYQYQTEFKAAERAARAAEKGLWAPNACASYSP